MPKFLDTVEVEATAKFIKSATDTLGSAASHVLFLDLDSSEEFLGIRLDTDGFINFDTYNGVDWTRQIYINRIENSVVFKREVVIGRPGGPEGYGYGYGPEAASTGSLILYGDLYVDNDAVFAEDVVINGKLTVVGLIDPTGLELDPQISNPGGIEANTIWINSGDSLLYYGAAPITTGGSIGGSDTQVQFNDSGVFGANAGMTYNKSKRQLKLTPSLTSASPPDSALLIDLGTQFVSSVQANGIEIDGEITLNDEDTEIFYAKIVLGGSVDAYGRDLDFARCNIDTSGLGGGAGAHDSFLVRMGGQLLQSSVQSSGAFLHQNTHMHSIKSDGVNVMSSTNVVDARTATDFRFTNTATTDYGGGLAYSSGSTSSHRAGLFWRRTGGGGADAAIMLCAGNGNSDLLNVGIEVNGTTGEVRGPSAFDWVIESTTSSTTSTSGALILGGGAGIGGNVNIGSAHTLNTNGSAYFDKQDDGDIFFGGNSNPNSINFGSQTEIDLNPSGFTWPKLGGGGSQYAKVRVQLTDSGPNNNVSSIFCYNRQGNSAPSVYSGLFYAHHDQGSNNEWAVGLLGHGRNDSTNAGSQAIGVYGRANGGENSIAIYGTAADGTNNWAGYFDGAVYVGDTIGTAVSTLGISSSGKIVVDTSSGLAGDDTQVQFNDNGTHGADPHFTFEKTNNTLTIGQPGGPEGYGYGYGEEGASVGSLILYGDLYVDDDATFAENVSLPNLATGTLSSLIGIDASGLLIDAGPAGILIAGSEALNTSTDTYTISNSGITTDSTPVCTVVGPDGSATIFVSQIYDIQNGSFKIKLSGTPPVLGYELNWISSGIVSGGGGSSSTSTLQEAYNTGNTITLDGTNHFIVNGGTSGSFTIDAVNSEVTIDGKLTVTGLIDPTGLELDPQASNPGGIAENTIWIDNADGSLKFGSDNIALGGSDVNPGTTAGSMLRWSGAVWSEVASVELQSDGDLYLRNAGQIGQFSVQAQTDGSSALSSANVVGPGGGGNLSMKGYGASCVGTTNAGVSRAGLCALQSSSTLVLDIQSATTQDMYIHGLNNICFQVHDEVSAPYVDIPLTTDSTNTASGALTIAGGVGIGGDVNIAGSLGVPTVIVSESLNAEGTPLIIGAPGGPTDGYGYGNSTGSLILYGDLYVDDDAVFAENLTVSRDVFIQSDLVLGGSVETAKQKGIYITGVTGSNQIVDRISKTAADGAKWVIKVRDGVNLRMTEIMAIWDGSTTPQVSTTSTGDVGDTSSVSFNVSYSGSNVVLTATVGGSTWDFNILRTIL